MRKGIVVTSVVILLAQFSSYAFSSVPVWLARDPPWPCSYGNSVRQYGSSALEAFNNLFEFKAERCFIGCANTPYPPPSSSCPYRYEFETLLTGSQCTAPGTCFRYRYFDQQNPQYGWQTADTYFRLALDRFNACPDGSIVGTDENALLACEVPATPWSEEKNLGMACASHTLAGNPVNVATGNKVHSERDIHSPSSRLAFERFYNSRNVYDIGMGTGWTSTWHRRLEVSAFRVMVRDADGRSEQWNDTAANQLWVGEGDTRIRLVESNDQFEITREDDSVETYHFTGRLLGIASIDGVTTTLRYQDSVNPDRLLTVANSIGESLAFTYTPDNHIETVTDHAGNVWTYTYDADNNLEYVYLPDGSADGYSNNPYRRFHYNEPALIENGADLPNHLTGISDWVDGQEKRYASYEYFANGRARSSYHSDNAGRVDITYDDINYTRTLTNSKGNVSVYAIDTQIGVAQVAGINGPGCATCGTGDAEYYHDPENNNLLYRKENDVYTKYADYDGNGNYRCKVEGITSTDLTDLTDAVVCAFDPSASPDARITYYTYDPRYFSRIATITEPSVHAGSGKVTIYGYDDYGNRATETITGFRPDGAPVSRTTTREYHGPLHQLTRIDGPRTDVSDITILRYYPDDPAEGNNRARLKEIEDATGVLNRRNIQYTATGKVASEGRPNDLNLSYSYYPGNDRLKTLTESSASGVQVTRWTYLATGEVQSITAADGTQEATTVTFSYDAARRLVRITDGLNNYIEYTLDTEGKRIAEHTNDSSGTLYKALTRTFDAYNRLDLTKSGGNPASPLEQVDADYASDGSLDKSTDGNGSVTGYSYDAFNRLLTATQDLGGTDPSTANALTQYGYDVADRLITVIDPNNGTTTYQYDDLGNLLATTSPDTGTTTYSYDDAGNVLSKTTASSTPEAISHIYSYDALNRLTAVTTPDPQEDIIYTWDSCPNGSGRLCRVATGSATVFYRYDGFGNVTTHQGVLYTHDAASRLKTVTYPSGCVVTYHYNAVGQVSAVDLTVNGQTRSLAGSIGYVPFGGIASLTYGNGKSLTQAWDGAYRQTAQTVPGVLALGYPVYDRNGNLIQRDDSLGSTSSFGYDPFSRLDTASGPFGAGWNYDYDRNGNRLLGDEGSPVALGYEPGSNRLDQIGSADVVLSVAGNTLARGSWSYGYTAHQRLAAVSDNGSLAASFSYNGLGQRVTKARPDGSGETFLYGTDGALLVETDQAGTVLVDYIYLNGQLLAIYLPDTDQDGQTNRAEADLGTNPVNPDDDGDGLSNLDELLTYGTLINNPDTDGDGVSDGDEVSNGTDPGDSGSVSVPGDINADGLVTTSDYLLLMQMVLGNRTPSPAEFAAGDLNQDGQLNAGDLVILSRTVLGLAWQTVVDSAISRTLFAIWEELIDTAVAVVTQGQLYYVHTDQLGTPQVMTDEAGSVVWRASHDPFGKATMSVNTVELNVRFPGQYFDVETGLHYNYFRYYDPKIGRYITSDPIGLEGGLNAYTYVGGNPLSYLDPYGLEIIGQWWKEPTLTSQLYADCSSGNCARYTNYHTYIQFFFLVEALIEWEILCKDTCSGDSWFLDGATPRDQKFTIEARTPGGCNVLPGLGKPVCSGIAAGIAWNKARDHYQRVKQSLEVYRALIESQLGLGELCKQRKR